MSIDFRCLLEMLLVTNPYEEMLNFCIGVVGCLCTISFSDWCAGMALQQLMKRSPSSASVVEDMAVLIVLATVKTEPLLDGYSVLLETKKCPTALLLVFDL